jgi:hypothetical protein
MAIARCENCGCPKGKKLNVYSPTAHYPVGHPNSGVVCGTANCNNPGLVWLLDHEQRAYSTPPGQRIFKLTGNYNFTKFIVQ